MRTFVVSVALAGMIWFAGCASPVGDRMAEKPESFSGLDDHELELVGRSGSMPAGGRSINSVPSGESPTHVAHLLPEGDRPVADQVRNGPSFGNSLFGWGMAY